MIRSGSYAGRKVGPSGLGCNVYSVVTIKFGKINCEPGFRINPTEADYCIPRGPPLCGILNSEGPAFEAGP